MRLIKSGTEARKSSITNFEHFSHKGAHRPKAVELAGRQASRQAGSMPYRPNAVQQLRRSSSVTDARRLNLKLLGLTFIV